MTKYVIHELVEHACPVCQQKFTATSPAGEYDNEDPPVEGDPSLCINCGTLLVFDADGKQVLPPAEFLDDFDAETKEHILDAQAILRRAISKGLMC